MIEEGLILQNGKVEVVSVFYIGTSTKVFVLA